MKQWTISTDDMTIRLELDKDKVLLTYLGNKENWVREPEELRLAERIIWGEERIIARWVYEGAQPTEVEGGKGWQLTFVEAASGLRARSVWTAHPGPGAVEHRFYYENTTDKNFIIFGAETLDVALGVGAETDVFYVHKDRAACEIMSYMRSGYGTFNEPLTDRYLANIWTTPDCDDTGFIPLVMLHAQKKHGIYIGYVWNYGRILVRGVQGDSLKAFVRVGQFDDFRVTLNPGDTFDTPAVFIGAFEGEIDDASNRLRKWLFLHMMPEINRTNEQLPYVNWNAFYNTAINEGSWTCREDLYYPMMDAIHEVGVEEVTIDVGWWEQYGDWRSSSKYWPKGMAAASQYAHDRGMQFTLYFTFTNDKSTDENALTSVGPNGHPEWYLQYLKGDFGIPAFRQFATEQLEKRFNEYNVDCLRTDYDPIIIGKADGNKHCGVNDGAYWSEKGYLELLDYFYQNRPNFRYQNCSGGGALKGYAVMKRSCDIQVTDTFQALTIRKAVWDSAYCYPMMQIMTQLGDVCCGGVIGTGSYRFRTYLMAAPSAHIELPSVMPKEDHDLLKKLIAIFKERIRPLVRYADVYHTLPRPDGFVWDGIEYYDPKTGKGVTMIFKPDSETDTQVIRWKGLEPDARYLVSFTDGTNPDGIFSGKALLEGVEVTLKGKFVGEWMFVDKL